MGDITIRIPQKIHIEYTLKSRQMTKRILDLLNTLILRNENHDRQVDENSTQAALSDEHKRLGDLALQLFGTEAGVELDFLPHTPHHPLELGLPICRPPRSMSCWNICKSSQRNSSPVQSE